MGNAVVAGRDQIASGSDKAKAAVLDRQSPALQIDQPVPVSMGDASLLQTEATP